MAPRSTATCSPASPASMSLAATESIASPATADPAAVPVMTSPDTAAPVAMNPIAADPAATTPGRRAAGPDGAPGGVRDLLGTALDAWARVSAVSRPQPQ